MADWSRLPCDVLGEIALKLDTVEDFIYFSAVCHSWNQSSSLVKPKLNAITMMPWVLLAENTKNNPYYFRNNLNLNNNKCYQLKLPQMFGARCWGSHYGWVVVQTRDLEIELYNPLTNDRITTLPSVQTMPNQPESDSEDEENEKDEWIWKHFVKNFVVLKMPSSDQSIHNDGSDLLIAAIYGEQDYLALARPGDQAWVMIDTYVASIVCSNDLIFILGHDLWLRYCDIKQIGDFEAVKIMQSLPPPPLDGFFRNKYFHFDRSYLVELGGELLVVIRHKTLIQDFYGSVYISNYYADCFKVFRLNYESKKWVEVKDLGNFIIFLGLGCNISIPTSSSTNWKRNCIYYADLDIDLLEHDMGVYDMESKKISQIYQGDDAATSGFCPPIFYVPKLSILNC